MPATTANVIGQYEHIRYTDPDDAFRPYDPRCGEVATRLAAMIQAGMPEARVELVGSTAIPGCHGKGPVDLMLLYLPGRLAAARDLNRDTLRANPALVAEYVELKQAVLAAGVADGSGYDGNDAFIQRVLASR